MLPFARDMPWRHGGGSDPLKLKMHQTLFRQTYKLSGLRPSFLLFTDTVNKNPCYSNMIYKRKLCPKVQTLTEMVFLLYTFYWQKVPPSYASSRTAYLSEMSGNLKSFFLSCFVFSIYIFSPFNCCKCTLFLILTNHHTKELSCLFHVHKIHLLALFGPLKHP